MSDLPGLEALLRESGLAEKADKVDDKMYRLQWGSAFVIVGTSGTAIVAIAPLFQHLPPGRELEFYKKLLEHNAYMGGMASFAIQPDGWIVLHSGRALRGLDARVRGAGLGGRPLRRPVRRSAHRGVLRTSGSGRSLFLISGSQLSATGLVPSWPAFLPMM
jgi:hypothetical protein